MSFNYNGINRRHTGELILKTYGVNTDAQVLRAEELMKSEGAKGGHVIGHTKSGKPIYGDKKAGEHKGFVRQDYKDAAKFHSDAARVHKEKAEEHDREAIKHGIESNSERSQELMARHDEDRVHHEKQAKKHETKSKEHQSYADDPFTNDREVGGTSKTTFEQDLKDAHKSEGTSNTPGKETLEKGKESPAEEKKIHKVMHEFKEGELHSGSKKGPEVHSRKQAQAIAISESKKDLNKGEAFAILGQEVSEEDLFKSEGDKGGKVIGHTKSGKSIYEKHNSTTHQDFTSGEHLEAHNLHMKKYDEFAEKHKRTGKYRYEKQHHSEQADIHEKFARQQKEKEGKK